MPTDYTALHNQRMAASRAAYETELARLESLKATATEDLATRIQELDGEYNSAKSIADAQIANDLGDYEAEKSSTDSAYQTVVAANRTSKNIATTQYNNQVAVVNLINLAATNTIKSKKA
jgi:hypothetical protein